MTAARVALEGIRSEQARRAAGRPARATPGAGARARSACDGRSSCSRRQTPACGDGPTVPGSVAVSDGIAPDALRVVAPADRLLALAGAPLRAGLPDPLHPDGRAALVGRAHRPGARAQDAAASRATRAFHVPAVGAGVAAGSARSVTSTAPSRPDVSSWMRRARPLLADPGGGARGRARHHVGRVRRGGRARRPTGPPVSIPGVVSVRRSPDRSRRSPGSVRDRPFVRVAGERDAYRGRLGPSADAEALAVGARRAAR